jgi:hypothetical protein
MGGPPDTAELKRRPLAKDEPVEASPKKIIEQPSKNLKDYDCWDEDLEPEEWLKKYLG